MSTKDMTLNQIKAVDSKFGANHTVKVSGFKDGNGGPKKPRNSKPPKYFIDFQNLMLEFIKTQEQHWIKQEQFNKHMLDFEKYVLDVFKRNNLK